MVVQILKAMVCLMILTTIVGNDDCCGKATVNIRFLQKILCSSNFCWPFSCNFIEYFKMNKFFFVHSTIHVATKATEILTSRLYNSFQNNKGSGLL